MQRLLIIGLVGVGIVAVVFGIEYLSQPLEVENQQQVIEEVENTPSCMTVLSDEDACKAAQDVIQRKKDEAELADVQAQIEDLEVRETELEKALNVY